MKDLDGYKARIAKAAGAAQEKAWGTKKKRRRRRTPGELLGCGCHAEDVEQRTFVREAQKRFNVTFYWTRAERYESLPAREWARQMGMLSGMPDLIAMSHPGLMVEMKARCSKHRLSRNQEEMIPWLRGKGWTVIVAHGAKDGLRQLMEGGYGQTKD